MRVVDLYAGAGGWDVAARRLGFDPLGIEMDADACATRRAAEMPTLEADITTLDPADFGPIDGLIASPPCQSFSAAGKRAGLDDPRGELVWTPLHWALALRPRWIACEQVPEVEPIWRMIAHRLEEVGYRTAVGVMRAEQFGVPQTRRRAILLAHAERPVTLPEPTHQRYESGVPQGDPQACHHGAMFGELLPWVSMAEALGRCAGRVGFPRVDDTGTSDDGYRERDWRDVTEPAFAVTEKARSWLIQGNQANACVRHVTEPAGTIAFGHNAAAHRWTVDRPATTVTTDSRIAAPGHHDENQRSFGDGAIRLSVADAAALQTFPPDHPWQGSRTSQHRQVGNALPVLLAEKILRQVV